MAKPDTDWAESWKEQMKLHNEDGISTECASIWDEKEAARKFWHMAHENGGERINKTISGLPLAPGYRVLDIGAGPGALAIPIAKKVKHLTAVEPSKGMCAVLNENICETGTENLDCIQKRWEDVDVGRDLDGPYDLVFASFSLGVPDIKSAIESMIEASSKWIYIYWFAGENTWEGMSADLWPQLHGKEYHPEPKCNIIYNVLYDMGIFPDITTFPLQHINRFSSPDDAVDSFRTRYGVKTPEQEHILHDYLSQKMQEDDGTIIIPGYSHRVKMWWQVD